MCVMKHVIIAGTVAAVLFTAVGCSSPNVSSGPASYLAVRGSKVAFIQWRTASHHLQGMITEGSAGGGGSAQTLSINSAPFTGTKTGNSVILTFATLYFLRAHAHGTVSGDGLTMGVPQSDGTLEQVKFRQSNKADFHRALAALHARITRANLMAAQQQASQRRQSAHAQAERSTQSALNALYRDSSIAHGGRLADGLGRLAVAIEAARFHLARAQTDASGDNKYCGAAFKVTGDALAVNGAIQNAQGSVSSLMPGIVAVRHDIVTLNAHLRHLSKSGVPAPSLASDVIAHAHSSLMQATAAANAYIQQANAVNARAHSLANNMSTRKCSSARSGTPAHSIPLISPAGGAHS